MVLLAGKLVSHLQRGIDPSPFEGFIPPFGRLDLDQYDNGADGTARHDCRPLLRQSLCPHYHPPASLYMTLAHEYAVKCLKGGQTRTQTQTQTRTQTQTQTQTRSPNRSPNRPHRISSALGMGAEGSSAGGKGGMNPSKGEGSIPRCSLYSRRRR